jgi:predicted acetyltransferase
MEKGAPSTVKSETNMRIVLLSAAGDEKPAVADLIQLYQSDLSGFNGAESAGQGCLGHARIDSSGGESSRPFLIRADEQLVGFALVGRESRRQAFFDGYTVADLFIKRCCRRQGFGRAAAIALFDRFPGPWEVSSCALNVPGQIFWRGVVDRYTNGRYVETWIQTATWRGPVQSFIAPPR